MAVVALAAVLSVRHIARLAIENQLDFSSGAFYIGGLIGAALQWLAIARSVGHPLVSFGAAQSDLLSCFRMLVYGFIHTIGIPLLLGGTIGWIIGVMLLFVVRQLAYAVRGMQGSSQKIMTSARTMAR